MKIFKTIEEQILILKERELIIENDNEVREILESTNYYNLINRFNQ